MRSVEFGGEREDIPGSDFPTECASVASRRASSHLSSGIRCLTRDDIRGGVHAALLALHGAAALRPHRPTATDILICILSRFGNRIVTFGEKED